MVVRLIAILALALAFPTPSTAQNLEGEYLYKVSTVRAASASLSELLDWIAALKDSDYYADAGEHRPFVMRHSQGDQWDLLIISPMESWTGFYSESAARKREQGAAIHIEMFAAAPGKAQELLEQRRMENAYLSATGQTANMIFRRAAGSDVDVFTIGFHKNLERFAVPASVTDEEKESLAKAAGFKGRFDISFYLRSLISGHHDTLAVKVE
jgi:hypothetical protein